MKQFRFEGILAAAALLLFGGCGYQFQGSGTSLPTDIKTIAVAPVENETLVAGLGREVEESIGTMIESFGALRVASSESDGDAVLRASIKNLDTRVRSVTGANDIALEYDLTITVAAELRRRNGQLLWRNPAVMASQQIAGTSSVVVTSGSDFAQGGISGQSLSTLDDKEVERGAGRAALNDLIEEISRRIYIEAVAEDF
ncbi:MAG: hypothetical protein KDD66_09440 [Bdellovibrionales bacterium]|nr:hypothetical protein [Bdellovibrionales bacterium]